MGIVTTQRQRFCVLDGIQCIRPEEMNLELVDYVIIAVQKWKDVYERLISLGITDEQILRSNIFYLPYFDLDGYLELKSSGVSILSNSCLGGMIYQKLGLKALSPTINAICLNFIEFLGDYRRYLNTDMQECHERAGDKSILGIADYPKGMIENEIAWVFPHAGSVKEAVEKWNEKRKCICYDNIAVCMVLQRDEDAFLFEQLPIRKKLGIYHKELKLRSVISCPDWESELVRKQYDFNYLRYVHRYFTDAEGPGRVNWIKFLSGEEDFLRY